MIHRIIVQREIDELNVQEWHFWFNDDRCQLVLDDYLQLVRPTKRHKFIVERRYNRLDRRNATIHLDAVPFPADVQSEAKQQLVDMITVVKERK